MMYIPITSKRLAFRRFLTEDYDSLYQLDGDAEVMQFIGEPRDKETVKSNLAKVIAYYDNHPGLGSFVTEFKSNQEFIGWTCLKHLDQTDRIEVGYRYLKKFWGQGIATEASKALIDYGFQVLGLRRIVAVAVPENDASIRVLEKTGFSYKRMDHFYNREVSYFELNNLNETN